MGALRALGGQVDFARDILGKRGVDFPFRLNGMGRYVRSAAPLGTGVGEVGEEP